MEYLIDGYNIIRSTYFKKWEESEKKVIFYEILGKYKAKHPSIIFTVVFDGFKSEDFSLLRDKRIKTIFSGNITADEYIKRRTEKGKRNDEVTVVSDDRQVQISSKLFGCKTLSVSEFMMIVNYSKPDKTKGNKGNGSL